eukprot:TRINITY_DN4671_c0_g1_i2.p1 TRINITY_DN4671_c0_g1~~TRINITY_DN4671_c0_g1_i2.p1  ORF type:complete len:178 (+),score=14.91 TRINITY_DN4671_c0_g1_i2:38-571(+)
MCIRDRCKKVIEGRTEYVDAFGYKFHMKCFKCTFCFKDLSKVDKYYNVSSKQTCEACMAKKYPTRVGNGRYVVKINIRRMPKNAAAAGGGAGGSPAPFVPVRKTYAPNAQQSQARSRGQTAPSIPQRHDKPGGAPQHHGGGRGFDGSTSVGISFCPQCGTKVDAGGQKFCGGCGCRI